MYVPESFREDRIPILHEAMRSIAFATLVTFGEDGLTASHIPLLLESEPPPYGSLAGHLARSNPQWQTADRTVDALAIFAGPHAYISPSWYPTKAKSGKVVPTWNYVAIHAYGRLRIIEDADAVRAHVAQLTAMHEGKRAAPWAVGDAPADYIAVMVKGIVGIELAVTRLEGKWKMSQNRPPEDRRGVAARLTAEGADDVAAIVTARSKPPRDHT
jgi:transcriptional regulator